MNSSSLANGGVPFSFIEGYFVFNCWFCAVSIPLVALAEVFGWRTQGSPGLLALLILVNSIILLAIQGFILSRRGRVEPLKSVHFLVPAGLFGAALLLSIAGLIIHSA